MERPSEELASKPSKYYTSHHDHKSFSRKAYKYKRHPALKGKACPYVVNEFLTMLKQSSLASIIGVVELTRRGEYVAAYTYRAFESYLIVASIYLAASYIFSYLSKILEKKYKIPGYTGV